MTYPNGLVLAAFALHQDHLALRDAEGRGKETKQVIVSRPVHGWCGDSQLEAIIEDAGEAIATRSGLDPELKHQIRSFPTVPVARHVTYNRLIAKALIGAIRIMMVSCSSMKTTKGDRSSPPMGGKMRRAGRSRGSVRL